MAMLMMRVTLLDLKDVVGNFPPHPMLRWGLALNPRYE
jgi:hypothetical protein